MLFDREEKYKTYNTKESAIESLEFIGLSGDEFLEWLSRAKLYSHGIDIKLNHAWQYAARAFIGQKRFDFGLGGYDASKSEIPGK